ncbi:MAG: hypothetical protein DRQ44_09040 [Gammaproteobacteria bacterium]|nr:MAG: hypothetical protein DRQ44_09040 [Gammaproteobacteria bacterium]
MPKKFHKAESLALLNSGHYDLALQQAQLCITGTPQNADALYIAGLAYLLKMQFADSIDHLQQALKLKPDDAALIANLGIAYLRSGDIDAAIKKLKQAIHKQSDYEQAHYNLGSAYIQNQQAELAIDSYQLLIRLQPENADYLCALADATRETGKWRQSVKLYKKVLSLDDRHYRAHTNMGPLMMHMGQLDEAIEHCKHAIEIKPAFCPARKNLGDCYLQLEQLEDAMETYADAYEIDPGNAELCVAIGNVWLETAEPAEAASWFVKANAINENNTTALCGLANIERDAGNLPLALDLLSPLHKKEPDNIEVLLCLSDTLWDDGDAEAALLHLEHLRKLQPQRTAIYAKIGHILASTGDVDGAIQQYQTAIKQNPQCIPVLSGLATTQRGKLDKQYAASMQGLLDKQQNVGKNTNSKRAAASIKPGARASLHNGLAFYYDGCKQYEQAAFHMQQANHFQWQHKSIRGWQYKTQQHENYITQLIETFDAEYFKNLNERNQTEVYCDSETPVFIVAMPRSGTTLTEQILARHDKVLGIGERNFASQSFSQLVNMKENSAALKNLKNISKLTADEIQSISNHYLEKLQTLSEKAGKTQALRIVDKMPDNYSMLGWILTLFPKAKIIHLQRDPADVALSCWMTQFGSIRWACHKEHLTHRIQQYQRIMQHWREVIPDRFIETSYEQLVSNQSKESARLIEYIDLDWDENCLKFYESDRLIRTASITQVRQPIYRKSVCRWKAYQPYISDLFIF